MTSPVILRSGADAEESARRLAASFAEGAADRDRQRRRPFAEIDALSQSGLLGIGNAFRMLRLPERTPSSSLDGTDVG